MGAKKFATPSFIHLSICPSGAASAAPKIKDYRPEPLTRNSLCTLLCKVDFFRATPEYYN
jgi:hypothetical protein